MKKYIVVKTNLLLNIKFYKIHKTADSWSIDKQQAHKYKLRWTAEKIAKAKNSARPNSFMTLVEYSVEEVTE